MRYLSTRGGQETGLVDAVMRGLAADGGLFVPDELPRFDRAPCAASRSPRSRPRCSRRSSQAPDLETRARRHLPRCVRFPAAAEAARSRTGELVGARAVSWPDGRVQGRRRALPGGAHGARAAPLRRLAAADDSRRDIGRHGRRRRRGVSSPARHPRRRAVPERPGIASPAAPAHLLGRQHPRVRGRRHVRRLPGARQRPRSRIPGLQRVIA